jgi:hypothetical protein
MIGPAIAAAITATTAALTNAQRIIRPLFDIVALFAQQACPKTAASDSLFRCSANSNFCRLIPFLAQHI